MKHIQRFLMGLACLVSMSVSAQWQWIDKDGRKVFSDRAPPSEVQDKNILKRPTARSGTNNNSASEAATAAMKEADALSTPKISGVDKELTDRKKKADEAAAAKHKADEALALKAKIENCAKAKQAKASLTSNTPLFRMNAKGEREVLDESVRNAEVKLAQSVIDTDCQ